MAKAFGKSPHELATMNPEYLSFDLRVMSWGIEQEIKDQKKLSQKMKKNSIRK